MITSSLGLKVRKLFVHLRAYTYKDINRQNNNK